MDSKLTARISPEHQRRLAWFEEHQGEVSGIPGPLADGLLLVSKPKGIYKPGDLPYALSADPNRRERSDRGPEAARQMNDCERRSVDQCSLSGQSVRIRIRIRIRRSGFAGCPGHPPESDAVRPVCERAVRGVGLGGRSGDCPVSFTVEDLCCMHPRSDRPQFPVAMARR
jgi:hypothetical protein